MAEERNGVIVFAAEEDFSAHPAVEALSTVSLGDVRFPFGFFLVDGDNGKRHVVPATEDDRMKVLLRAYSEISQVALRSACSHSRQGCDGGCPRFHTCRKLYHDATRYYGCACIDIS